MTPPGDKPQPPCLKHILESPFHPGQNSLRLHAGPSLLPGMGVPGSSVRHQVTRMLWFAQTPVLLASVARAEAGKMTRR